MTFLTSLYKIPVNRLIQVAVSNEQYLGCQKYLSVIIEGEALLNDGSAIVVFKICLELLKSTTPYFEPLTGEFVGT